jgi:hypothetical protein
MEEIPARDARRRRRLLGGLAVLVVGAVVAALALRHTRIDRFVTPGTPRVRLHVAVVDAERKPIAATDSRLADGAAPSSEPPPVERPPDETPPSTSGPGAVAPVSSGDRRPSAPVEPPERDATVRLTRAPIGLSLYVLDDRALLAWATDNPTAREVLSSELVRGAFEDALRTTRVRAEDLKLGGDVQGAFLVPLLRDVLGAGAALHYDASQGRRGWVLSFRRGGAPLVSRLLPPVLGALARRTYRVEKADLSVVEILVGEQPLFLAETDGIVHVGTSLRGVLQVIEVGPLPAPSGARGTVAVTVRAEAWVQNLLPLVTGSPDWHASWSVDLARAADAGSITTSGGTVFGHLRPALPPGVLASVPRDAFAAVAASLPVPLGMTPDDWNRIAHDGIQPATVPGTEPAGIALVWDVSAKNASLSDVGVAVQRGGGDVDAELSGYLRDGVAHATCAGGSVWLAATTELLLTRMREACERQSPSLLDWRSGRGRDAGQLVLLVDPGVGLAEMLAAGIGAASEARDAEAAEVADPEWKQRYLAAVERARASGDSTVARLPALVFEGQGGARGATLEGALAWR